MTLFLKLLLAHLIGDFFLQSTHWIKEKEKRKLKSPQLYIHILIHGALVLLLVWDLSFWEAAVFIALSHGIIDAVKLVFQKEKYKREWFLIDQVLHIIMLAAVWLWWENWHISLEAIFTERTWLYIAALAVLTLPVSVGIKIFISKWTPHTEEKEDGSLQSAGKYIGILERLFVFGFVMIGHLEAVGFLLAAKSIFRFGDLRESKDRKLTEYVLIGTLLSFGMSLITALVLRRLLGL